MIVFVLCFVMAYGGVYCLVYGFDEADRHFGRQYNLNTSDLSEVKTGDKVKANVYQQVRYLGVETFTPEILNIPISKQVEWHCFLVPVKYEEDAEDLRYYVMCFKDEESVKRMKDLYAVLPKPETNEPYEFKGIAADMTAQMKGKAVAVLEESTRLVGVDGLLENPTEIYYINRVMEFTFYEKTGDSRYLSALIVGGILVVGAVTAAVLMCVRIYREKYQY